MQATSEIPQRCSTNQDEFFGMVSSRKSPTLSAKYMLGSKQEKNLTRFSGNEQRNSTNKVKYLTEMGKRCHQFYGSKALFVKSIFLYYHSNSMYVMLTATLVLKSGSYLFRNDFVFITIRSTLVVR